MKLKLKFEWFEDELSCGSIHLVTLKRVLPTEHEAGYEMLDMPVLRDALVETGVQIGLREWIKTPLRLENNANVKSMVEALYTAVFERLDFEIPDANGPVEQSR